MIQKKFKLLKKQVDSLKFFIALLLTSLILAGCSASKNYFYVTPYALRTPENKAKFYDEYSRFISGKKFFLDPGHGGEDRRNKGYEGLAVEADLNLHVALALKNFLTEAGAEVIMSRESDTTVLLKDRSKLANNSGADLFISIHHNAPGISGDYSTDFTSTFYHANKGDYEYEPCNHDIAKYIQRDLAYAMRNSGGLGSFDGTYSDYDIYPGMGFSVLRLTKLPAVLVECSFNTSYFEAKRLVLKQFNQIEAWGIFQGLCKYFSEGVPQIVSLTQDSTFNHGNINLSFQLIDSTGIDYESVAVNLDTNLVSGNSLTIQSGILNINLQDVKSGEHIIRVVVANKNGNHSFPFYKKINVITE